MLGQLCTHPCPQGEVSARIWCSGCCSTRGFWKPAHCHPQHGTPGAMQICIVWEQGAPAPRPHGRCPGLLGTNLLPPTVTRGDVFALPEDDYLDYNIGKVEQNETAAGEPPTSLLPAQPTLEDKTEPEETPTEVPVEEAPNTTLDGFGEQEPVDEPEELCSRKPFDAFTDLKNGSLYAFRGTLGTFPQAHGTHCHAVTPRWWLQSLLLFPPPLSPQGSTSMSWMRRACDLATLSSSVTSGALRAPSTQPSPASTARAKLICSRWAGAWLQGWGCSQGGWHGSPTHPVPILAPSTHTCAPWLLDIPKSLQLSGAPGSHSLTTELPHAHSPCQTRT